MRATPTNSHRQQGASLMVTLVMLAVLMVAGVTAYVASNTQFRMAANLQFQNIALGNAESALARAEAWIANNYNNSGFQTRSNGGLYPAGTAPDPLAMTWNDDSSVKVDSTGSQRYMIERIIVDRVLPSNSIGNCNVYGMSGPCPRVNVYRLTARGTSILGTAKVVQSVFTVRINI